MEDAAARVFSLSRATDEPVAALDLGG
jgi:hypothetical protein